MPIKVEVIEPGTAWEETIECPDCKHYTAIRVSKLDLQGTERCWYCNALLKWEVVEGK